MKKKFTAIAAAAVLAMAALAGCGTTETTAADNGAASLEAASQTAGSDTASGAAGSEAASGEAASGAAAEKASEAGSEAGSETGSEAASAGADLSGSISMAGSTSMEKLSNALAESFMAKYPGVTVTAEFTGSGAGVEAVAAGSVDIGNASRNLTEEEKAGGVAENIVAIDGIAVVTDPANTASGLTREQLSEIYTGKIRNWKDVGGADQAIVVVGREAGSGTRGAFEELLEIEDQCAYANELDSTGAVMAKVAATPGAIGYVSLDVIDDTVKTLSVDEVEPTVENIKGGSYLLSRPFVMATKGGISEQNEVVQALFEYLASDEGKALIESVGLIVTE